MTYLKIIFYGLLAFIERNPIFCTVLVLIAIFAPIVFHVVGWILLGLLGLALLGIGMFVWRAHRMKRQMEKQFRDAMGGNMGNMGNMGGQGFSAGGPAGGFSGFASFGQMGSNGMTLEELVRQMQAQADRRQQASSSRPSSSTTTRSTGTKVGGKSDKVGDYVDFEEVE